MIENIPFLINSKVDIEIILNCDKQEFKDFFKTKSDSYINSIAEEFENKPNFELKLKNHLNNIKNAKDFINKLKHKDDKYYLIIKQYDLSLSNLKSKYNKLLPNIFIENFSQYLFDTNNTNIDHMKNLINKYTEKVNKKFVPGNEEYYLEQKLNQIFTEYRMYKIFYDYTELFKIDNINKFNYSDGSYLYRIMFKKKYIVHSVSENDFRIAVYDKFDLNFNKLKVLKDCDTIYRNIIFDFIEKQNRSQKNFFPS